MVTYFTHGLIICFIAFQLVVIVISLSNIIILRHARKYAQPINFPPVSILVPARNEEKNIQACVESLVAQDYPDCEVIVLDDQSSDATPAILELISGSHPQLKVLSGINPAERSTGKNWACAMLAQYAHNDLLLFTDADTIFKPNALRLIVSATLGMKADLMSGFPRQIVGSWGERLLVPFFSWAMLSFMPLWLAYRFRLPALSGAVGQMMLFRREAYLKIGGHQSLDNEYVDDLTLARRIKKAGLNWRLMRISDLISCRMYPTSHEALDGFSKNLFAAFDFHLSLFLFAYVWLGMLFLEPLVILMALGLAQIQSAHIEELILCICLSLLVWLIPYFEIGVPLLLVFLYPFTILANEVVAIRSLILSLAGRLSWKGRRLPHPKLKW
jgi:chlorobactene glucosyltransferase